MSAPNSEIIVLVGPTASGKTAVSLELARRFDAEIISADSRQLYKYLDIGTAKPTPAELSVAKHYFIDTRTPDQAYNAGLFSLEGRHYADDIISRGKRPIVVGGSGLYVEALVDGMFEGPSRDEDVRTILETELELLGERAMYVRLMEVDPESASRMDATKYRRVIRALEVYYLTGKPISVLQRDLVPIKYRCRFFGLQWDRAELYKRINNRVLNMLAGGLLEEVEKIVERGYTSEMNALQTVGYKEVFQYRNGEIDYNRMVELIQMNSRRYAKRQLTWFRADDRITWIPMDGGKSVQQVAEDICRHLEDGQEVGEGA